MGMLIRVEMEYILRKLSIPMQTLFKNYPYRKVYPHKCRSISSSKHSKREAEMVQHAHDEKKDDSGKDRYYEYSSLPIMRNVPPLLNAEEQKVRLELYKEICTSWRTLVDVRFKLLGFVPAASIAIIIVLLSSNTNELKLPPLLTAGIQTGIALFGLIVTYALYVYDQRNTQFHDDLISRGRRIEKELGVDTGQFLGRLKSHKSVLPHLPMYFCRDVFSWDEIPRNDTERFKEFLRKNFCVRFSWDEIPGKDSGRLKVFLKQNFGIDWVRPAKIEKIDDNRIIRISTEKNSLSLRLNDEKTRVNLTIDDGRTDEFVVKTENCKLDIYFCVNWVDTAEIKKSDDGKTIIVSTETNYLTLRLNDEETKAILTIDDGRSDEFIAKKKKCKLDIYLPKDLPIISKLWIFRVQHDTGTNLIYGTAIIGWLLTIVVIGVRWYFS